jgi:hypothetical protein
LLISFSVFLTVAYFIPNVISTTSAQSPFLDFYNKQREANNETSNVGVEPSLPNGLSSAASIQGENATDQTGRTTTNDTSGMQTYQDSQNGFKIEYPSEWGIEEPTSSSGLLPDSPFLDSDTNAASPPARTGVTLLPDDEPTDKIIKTHVSVDTLSTSRTLDPDTLQVTSLPPEHYAQAFIQTMTGLTEGSTLDTLKNEATTVSGLPAWQVEYISGYQGMQTSYGKNFYVVKDGKMFEIAFMTDPLEVPETRPIGEKIMNSFQFINDTAASN